MPSYLGPEFTQLYHRDDTDELVLEVCGWTILDESDQIDGHGRQEFLGDLEGLISELKEVQQLLNPATTTPRLMNWRRGGTGIEADMDDGNDLIGPIHVCYSSDVGDIIESLRWHAPNEFAEWLSRASADR